MRPLDEVLQLGQTVKVFYNEGNPNNEIRHIRALIDDEYVVYRVWSEKGGWLYRIEHRYTFDLLQEKGKLS